MNCPNCQSVLTFISWEYFCDTPSCGARTLIKFNSEGIFYYYFLSNIENDIYSLFSVKEENFTQLLRLPDNLLITVPYIDITSSNDLPKLITRLRNLQLFT